MLAVKKTLKAPISDADIRQELKLMRMKIIAMQNRFNRDFGAMTDQINRLLPGQESDFSRRAKYFTKKDWNDYLNDKLKIN